MRPGLSDILCPLRTDFFTLPYQQHRDPSYGELCWQVFTSLTIGAKGILYFTYWCAPCLPCLVQACEGFFTQAFLTG